MSLLGKKVFISYRSYGGKGYEDAQTLAHWLVNNGYCEQVVVFPPNSLSASGEQFLPYEYVELMEFILDELARCQAFVYIDTPGYSDSYFTQAEILQWRRFKDEPVVYPAQVNGNHVQLGAGTTLETLSHNLKQAWASISVGTARSYRSHLNPGLATGKYAKSCFLVGCGKCGEHFLVTRKAVYAQIKGKFRVACPHCGNDQFPFKEEEQRGLYYRKPITLQQTFATKMRVLEMDEILHLLLQNTLPPKFKLVQMGNERLDSDLATLGKLYLGIGAVLGGLIGLAALLGGKDDD